MLNKLTDIITFVERDGRQHHHHTFIRSLNGINFFCFRPLWAYATQFFFFMREKNVNTARRPTTNVIISVCTVLIPKCGILVFAI